MCWHRKKKVNWSYDALPSLTSHPYLVPRDRSHRGGGPFRMGYHNNVRLQTFLGIFTFKLNNP